MVMSSSNRRDSLRAERVIGNFWQGGLMLAWCVDGRFSQDQGELDDWPAYPAVDSLFGALVWSGTS